MSKKMQRMSSRDIIRRLLREGWEPVRESGDHHTFKHSQRQQIITVPHPKKDLPIGTQRDIQKKAGWL